MMKFSVFHKSNKINWNRCKITLTCPPKCGARTQGAEQELSSYVVNCYQQMDPHITIHQQYAPCVSCLDTFIISWLFLAPKQLAELLQYSVHQLNRFEPKAIAMVLKRHIWVLMHEGMNCCVMPCGKCVDQHRCQRLSCWIHFGKYNHMHLYIFATLNGCGIHYLEDSGTNMLFGQYHLANGLLLLFSCLGEAIKKSRQTKYVFVIVYGRDVWYLTRFKIHSPWNMANALPFRPSNKEPLSLLCSRPQWYCDSGSTLFIQPIYHKHDVLDK